MSARHAFVALTVVALAALMTLASFRLRGTGAPKPSAAARLVAVGPRQISNQSAYPVMIWGEGLAPGLALRLDTKPPVTVPTSFLDAGHLTAVIPAGLPILPALSTASVKVELVAPDGRALAGDARITVSNDVAFPNPYALELAETNAGPRLVVASPNTDELRVIGDGETRAIHAGDRPRAFARWTDPSGARWIVVAHGGGALHLVAEAALTSTVSAEPRGAVTTSTTAPIELPSSRVRRFDLGTDLQDVVVDQAKNLAYLTSHQLDRVVAFDLASGALLGTLPAGLNPRALAIGEAGKVLVVANIHSEDVSIVDVEHGTETRVAPGPGTPIIGGHTERYVKEIMGGKAGRGLVYSERLHVAFMSTIGPNIGPNADRMEVTENGGVSVIDALGKRYLRHVSMLAGVPEGLALDDVRGLLYVADGATGRLAVFDAKKLAASDEAARTALLATLLLPRPEGVPLIRPAADLGVEGRSTESLHFGAKAVRLSASGDRAFVLARFSGAIAEVDTSAAAAGKLAMVGLRPGWVKDAQVERRRGEIVYFTDLGGSRMTCDTCHPEGTVGGVMFSKGRPIRIYRGQPLRAIRESPPYFTPSRLPSIRRTAQDVLARNRFHNPDPTEEEETSLTEYVGAIAGIPNPYVGVNGELPNDVVLPDGAHGDAVRGLRVFESKGCAAATCHPAPAFTADASPKTRGLLHKLGTPKVLELRTELQDVAVDFGQPPPSLMGIWDIWPLFLSGAGGNEVSPEGTIVPKHPFALRWMLENPAWAGHGDGPNLSEAERNDLLAYLLTL